MLLENLQWLNDDDDNNNNNNNNNNNLFLRSWPSQSSNWCMRPR
jgi:hypothetical protein